MSRFTRKFGNAWKFDSSQDGLLALVLEWAFWLEECSFRNIVAVTSTKVDFTKRSEKFQFAVYTLLFSGTGIPALAENARAGHPLPWQCRLTESLGPRPFRLQDVMITSKVGG